MKVNILDDGNLNGYFVHVTEHEALKLIASLSLQLRDKNSNGERMESYTDKGEYFSIGVEFKE